jgi:ABC-2 type transport system permease protein
VIAQLRSELLKQRTTRATGALLLWMLVLIVVIVLLHSFGLSASSLRVAGNQPKVYGWGTSIGALFAALLGTLSMTSTIRTGTIRPTLLATPNRTLVIGAKMIAAAAGGGVVGLIAEVLVCMIANAAFAIRGIPIALTAGDFSQMLAGGAAAAALWAAIGTGVGATVRSQVGAVVGLCVWLLLIETVLAGEVPSVAKFTPGASAGALAGMLQSAGSLKLVTPAVAGSATSMTSWYVRMRPWRFPPPERRGPVRAAAPPAWRHQLTRPSSSQASRCPRQRQRKVTSPLPDVG